MSVTTGKMSLQEGFAKRRQHFSNRLFHPQGAGYTVRAFTVNYYYLTAVLYIFVVSLNVHPCMYFFI